MVLTSRPAASRDLFPRTTERKDAAMLGFVAAVLFIIAFLLYATSTATIAVFSPASLMLVGLACLALHLAGVTASRRWRTSADGGGGGAAPKTMIRSAPARRLRSWPGSTAKPDVVGTGATCSPQTAKS